MTEMQKQKIRVEEKSVSAEKALRMAKRIGMMTNKIENFQ